MKNALKLNRSQGNKTFNGRSSRPCQIDPLEIAMIDDVDTSDERETRITLKSGVVFNVKEGYREVKRLLNLD